MDGGAEGPPEAGEPAVEDAGRRAQVFTFASARAVFQRAWRFACARGARVGAAPSGASDPPTTHARSSGAGAKPSPAGGQQSSSATQSRVSERAARAPPRPSTACGVSLAGQFVVGVVWAPGREPRPLGPSGAPARAPGGNGSGSANAVPVLPRHPKGGAGDSSCCQPPLQAAVIGRIAGSHRRLGLPTQIASSCSNRCCRRPGPRNQIADTDARAQPAGRADETGRQRKVRTRQPRPAPCRRPPPRRQEGAVARSESPRAAGMHAQSRVGRPPASQGGAGGGGS